MTRDVGTSVNAHHPDVTALFANFLTKYRPEANGEFATFGWRALAHPIAKTAREQTIR